MEAVLRKTLSVEVQLLVGDQGAFEVIVDGERIFSKQETGRFPRDAEIIEGIRARS